MLFLEWQAHAYTPPPPVLSGTRVTGAELRGLRGSISAPACASPHGGFGPFLGAVQPKLPPNISGPQAPSFQSGGAWVVPAQGAQGSSEHSLCELPVSLPWESCLPPCFHLLEPQCRPGILGAE